MIINPISNIKTGFGYKPEKAYDYHKTPINADNSPQKKGEIKQLKNMSYVFGCFLALGVGLLSLRKYSKGLVDKKLLSDKEKTRFNKIFQHLLPTERPTVDKMLQEGLPEDLAGIFVKVKNIKDKKEFARAAYMFIAEHMGYKMSKPRLKFEIWEGKTAASWNPINANITVYERGALTNSKASILGTLRHELEHFVQDSDIARTEGFGTYTIANSLTQRIMRTLKEDEEFCMKIFEKKYSDITPEELETFQAKNNERNRREINKYLYDSVKSEKGLISSDSPHVQRVKEYIDASINYTQAAYSGNTRKKWETEKAYEGNLLEKLANEAGNKLRKPYEDFILRLADAFQQKKS